MYKVEYTLNGAKGQRSLMTQAALGYFIAWLKSQGAESIEIQGDAINQNNRKVA